MLLVKVYEYFHKFSSLIQRFCQNGNRLLTVVLATLVAVILIQTPVISQEFSGYERLIKGMEVFKAKEYEMALDNFQKAQLMLPDDPDIPFFIGMTYLEMVKPEEAIPYFKKTIEVSPDYWDAYFQLSTALVTSERFKEALDYLEKLYNVQPQRENLGCLLGMACYREGRYEDALNYLETGVSSDRMSDVVILYTGLTRQKLGQRKEARIEFRDLYTTDPTSPFAAASRRLDETLRLEEKVVRPYQFNATFRSFYDDNVRLIPTEDVFGVGHRKNSFGQSVFLRGEYSLLKRQNNEINVSYGYYQTIYNSERKYDVQDHIPGLSFIYRGKVGPVGYNARLDYFFDWIFLDYHWFMSTHTTKPSLALTTGPYFTTLLSYTFKHKNFRIKPDFEADDRDSVNHEVGLTQFFHTSDGENYIKFGYYRKAERADGDNWDYDSNTLLGGLQFTAPDKLQQVKLNVDYTWEDRNHLNANIFFDRHREDIERSVSTTVSKDIGDHITVFGNYLRRDNSSNMKLYNYEKNIYTLGITYRH